MSYLAVSILALIFFVSILVASWLWMWSRRRNPKSVDDWWLWAKRYSRSHVLKRTAQLRMEYGHPRAQCDGDPALHDKRAEGVLQLVGLIEQKLDRPHPSPRDWKVAQGAMITLARSEGIYV